MALVMPLLAGCLTEAPGPSGQAAAAEAEGAPARPVVVAVLGQGINLYHEAFRADPAFLNEAGVTPWLDAFVDSRRGHAATVVTPTFTPDFYDSMVADLGTLQDLEEGRLYAFTGTNILGASFHVASPTGARFMFDHWYAGLPGLIRDVAPSVVLVSVQVPDFYQCLDYVDTLDPASPGAPSVDECEGDPTLPLAMSWVADQPWIDVVVLPFTTTFNTPSPKALAVAKETRRAVDAGKLVVAPGSNYPTLGFSDGGNRPPWVIMVSAMDGRTRGEQHLYQKLPDVVAEKLGYVPAGDSVSDREAHYLTVDAATMSVGAYFARAISEVRQAWGHRGGIEDGALAVAPDGWRATPWTFRDAMNLSAMYWNVSAWTMPQTTDPVTLAFGATTPILHPAVQMGWGFMDDNATVELVRRVRENDFTVPVEKEEAASLLGGVYAAREQYWEAASRV